MLGFDVDEVDAAAGGVFVFDGVDVDEWLDEEGGAGADAEVEFDGDEEALGLFLSSPKNSAISSASLSGIGMSTTENPSSTCSQ